MNRSVEQFPQVFKVRYSSPVA